MKLKVRLIKFVLRKAGFHIDYTVPPEAHRSVVVFAPHTSVWDFIIGKMVFVAMGVNIKFMIKKGFFKFPVKRLLLKWGGIPVDKNRIRMLPVDVGNIIKKSDKMAILVAPEGTRKLVKSWKRGFYFIAEYAQVPMALGYLDWKTKKGGIGPCVYPSGNYEKDLKIIQDFYRGMQGKHPERFNL
ncbi:MAG: glycerol acyltransferase [Bacteroidales bacterium]|nr:glycerol acyltransferase [Bacteroidales bacterium]